MPRLTARDPAQAKTKEFGWLLRLWSGLINYWEILTYQGKQKQIYNVFSQICGLTKTSALFYSALVSISTSWAKLRGRGIDRIDTSDLSKYWCNINALLLLLIAESLCCNANMYICTWALLLQTSHMQNDNWPLETPSLTTRKY